MVFEYVVSGQLKVSNQPDPTSLGTVNQGIFDFTNAKNPFKDWYVVYLPYCTGDLFWGAADTSYNGVTIQHHGFVNFMAVLEWVQKNFRLPQEVFVAGSSAGGYGAILDYPYIRDAFPLTRVYVLGDAANGVTGDDFIIKAKDKWNIQYPAWILPGDITDYNIQDIYTNIAAEYPLMKLAQYTTAFDQTQFSFYYLQLHEPPFDYPTGTLHPFTPGSIPIVEEPSQYPSSPPLPSMDNLHLWYLGVAAPPIWHSKMITYTLETAATAPNYRYYIGAGYDHTILTSPKFYTETSAGVSFAQWVKSMVDNPFGVFGGPLEGIWKNVPAQ